MTTTPQPKFENVMIIDDNHMDLYISSRNITKYLFGNKVLQYSSALDALEYLQANQNNSGNLPQVIFVDIYMPIMSGFEFMVEYDKLSTTLKTHCRTFIISSSIDEKDIESAHTDINIIAFQEKPLTKEFLQTINEY